MKKFLTLTLVFFLLSTTLALSFAPEWDKSLATCKGSPKIVSDLNEKNFWKNCHGKIKFPNGMLLEGDFEENILSGYLLVNDGYGMTILGNMKMGQGNGYMNARVEENYLFPESATYSGYIKNYMFNGFGKLSIDQVATYYGNFVDNSFDGYGIIQYPDGTFYNVISTMGEIISLTPITSETNDQQSSALSAAAISFAEDTKLTFNMTFEQWTANLDMYHVMYNSVCDDYSYPDNLSMCSQVGGLIYNYVLPIYDKNIHQKEWNDYPNSIIIEWKHLIDNPFSEQLEESFIEFEKTISEKGSGVGFDIEYSKYTDQFFYLHRYVISR